MSFNSTNYMTLQKSACAWTEIFQDVFKLQDRDFKQCSEGEKAMICGFSFSHKYEGLYFIK